MKHRVSLLFVMVAVSMACVARLDAQSKGTEVREALQRTVPAPTDKQLHISLVEVTYSPGGSSKSHSHDCPVFGYVVRGAVRMKIGSGPENVFKSGDVFYEPANAVHEVSSNASETEPATFVAYFVCGGDKPRPTQVSNGAQR